MTFLVMGFSVVYEKNAKVSLQIGKYVTDNLNHENLQLPQNFSAPRQSGALRIELAASHC